ncbi:MAG: SHOCT domain-containing protein [Solirubrobacterales bacterium]|nr:SHOCT domain-containing protein [Solirubrobacterales bacterium]MBV9915085.1 SHOCT domain-containing protein [Solirubrobacterales bacterium]
MGLLKTATRAAVASSVHGRVQRRQQARWAQQEAQVHAIAGSPAQTSPPPAAAPRTADTHQQLELLKQLGELRDAGIVTAAEFETKKAEILAK